MKKKCFIACYDAVMEGRVISTIQELNSGVEIVVIKNESELSINIRCSDNITIYFDKFFLGYILKYKIISYKILNPDVNIVFVEQGFCPVYFGLRLHNIGVNSFICNIEDANLTKGPFLKTFEKINYYPEEVLASLENKEHLLESKCCSEITERELEIALYTGLGKTPKEISYILDDISAATVGTHLNRLRKKTGYKCSNDLLILNNRTLLRDSGANYI